MVSVNRSFVYGICFASITWIVSLYLYTRLIAQSTASYNSPDVSPYLGESIDVKSYKLVPEKKTSDELLNISKAVLAKPKGYINKDEEALSELGMVKSEDDQKLKDDGYKRYAFNVLISNKLSYHRSIPDTRNALCKNLTYPDALPSASIIICFYNEHYHTLLRTIHSIIDRVPERLLKEILLVDDFSDIKDLHDDVNKYISSNFDGKVKLFKTERREGLIRARLYGARRATGEVLVFLDSHVEVNVGWLEPLLARIKENHKNVAVPVIDIINADTFIYTSSPLVRGGFNWGLHFKWENLPKGTLSKKEDFVKPIKSPTMAGGLFAIDRKYFKELGEYDAGMNVWGGENLELSFRVWMCGGRLDIIPCSRVGHIFRQRRPYGDPEGQDSMLHNSLRVAHVWMDDYKKYFLKQRVDAKSVNYGNVQSRIKLRKELQCRDFDWYLKNVYPELALPSDDEERLKKKWAALERDKFQPWHSRKRNYIAQYQIKLSNTSLCIQSAKDIKTKGGNLILRPCSLSKKQLWYETDKAELVLAQLLCLQVGKSGPILYKCHEMGADQGWKHSGEKATPIYNMASGTCLAAEEAKVNANVIMRLCTNPDLTKWDLIRT